VPKKNASFADLGFAKVDLARRQRQGFPEVIFAQGKTPGQAVAIAKKLHAKEKFVFITRASPEIAAEIVRAFPAAHIDAVSRTIRVGKLKNKIRCRPVAVLCAGTSDLPVAEEAAATVEAFGFPVKRLYDVGVAGIHRLLAQVPMLRRASVLIVAAGMEGALPSAVAGLVDKPVIAVPTSVGYGASYRGIAALLGMLNSCGSGVTVVNIDNGFGAAFAACQILRLKGK
jgi:NCAIR mutase (PurE)-related protein